MRFLNPKTDLAFRKIFGSESSREILISFLNAILDLKGEDTITDVQIVDPYLAPKIQGMKDTYLDVRVKDQRGRSYIVEMQVLNVPGFEKRVLYNACKAYVNQLNQGDHYRILTEVVAVTITDFVMFPEIPRVLSRFRLREDQHPTICSKDLELVFAELPKFQKSEAELESTLDRWLYFLKTAGDLTAVPRALSDEPAIVRAFDLANAAAWTREELDDLEKRAMWLAEQRYFLEDAEARGLTRGLTKGLAQGRAEGQAEMLLRLLQRRFGELPDAAIERVRGGSLAELDAWSDRFVSARSLDEVFADPSRR